METAGPRRRVQRHHRRDRPAGADRAAAAVPALDGLRRHADPARLGAGGDHAAAGRDGEARLAARLAAPAHRRQGEPRVDALGDPRRAAPLGRGAAPAWRSCSRSSWRPPTCSSARSDANTMAKSGDSRTGLVALEKAGIGEGALLPHEILVERGTDPGEVARAVAGVDGIHGAVAPGGPAVAPRRHRARRGDPGARQRHGGGRRHARRACARRPTRSVPT